MPSDLSHTLQTTSGIPFVLSPDEYRLALLGLADFEGHWDIFEAAAVMVVDGQTKAAMIRQRLTPMADHLASLMDEELDVLRLWMARHWFASQFCQETT